jgi:hypothetical protein
MTHYKIWWEDGTTTDIKGEPSPAAAAAKAEEENPTKTFSFMTDEVPEQ